MFATLGAFFKRLVDTPAKAAATTYVVIAAAHVPGNVKEAKAKGKGVLYVLGHSATLGLIKPYMNDKSAQPAPIAPTTQPTVDAPVASDAPKTEIEVPKPVNTLPMVAVHS